MPFTSTEIIAMKVSQKIVLIAMILTLLACNNSNECSQDDAYNRMMALGRAQSRIIASGVKNADSISSNLTAESAAISELIAAGNFQAACNKAEEVAKGYNIDLAKELEGMVTFEQLSADGGKGSGSCSLADASKKLMEIHQLLQAQVDAGKMSSDIFRRYNDDTSKFAELMYTNPSEECKKLDELKKSYGL